MLKVVGALLVSFSTGAALAECAGSTAPQILELVSPSRASQVKPVDVKFEVAAGKLLVEFRVRALPINAINGPLKSGEYPYQKDVVELFLSVDGSTSHRPYYEFELSPYGNSFEVLVDEKGKFHDGIKTGASYETALVAGGWIGKISIPLESLNWSGDPAHLIGNAFGIVGKGSKRSFWSLTLPKQERPSFHKPEFFRPLLNCR